MQALPALQPFDSRVLALLTDVSAALLEDKGARAYPDVVTFAFFCRRANLEKYRKEYEARIAGRLGRGFTFHIAPGNVPINFAYSMVAALLAGNACVVKASSKDFPQTRIVCSAIQRVTQASHPAMEPYATVLTYPREQQSVTEALSALCDVRIIWGGDETIRQVRKAPLGPFAFDVTFADRYSLLCIRSAALDMLDDTQLNQLAQGFYNDTFLTDQNACTSPRLVYWVTEDDAKASAQKAQARFWSAMHGYASSRYPVQPVNAVDKLDALYRASVALPGVSKALMPDNLIVRARLSRLTPEAEALRCAGGFFLEYEGSSLDALVPFIQRKVQTISYLGFDPQTLRDWVISHGVKGIDRIVPIGRTMDFDLCWDGYDLIESFSRQIGTTR